MKIKFRADDVRPSGQKDGSWNIVFSCGEESSQAVALLALLRNKCLEVEVEEAA